MYWGSVGSPLGPVLVAATERGVCGLGFGPPHHVLPRLGARLPHARLTADGTRVAAFLDALRRSFSGRSELERLPLDIKGTPFQRRVWDELRRIPRGEVRTYGEVARAVGAPAAARAVARACATNPVALVIPCHRVVPADGSTGGYSWGPGYKRALLEQERLTGS